jgi:nucleotide-binding universal stress UspA family protein
MRILVGVDPGEQGAEALRQAEAWAKYHRWELIVHRVTGEGVRELVHAAEREAVRVVLFARPHPPTGRVLVGTNLASASLEAVRLAAEHARLTGASLAVACSIQRRAEQLADMTNLGSGYGFLTEEYQELRHSAERQLEGQLRAVGASGAKVILEGPPAEALARAAKERDVDLLVVGAVGASGMGRIRLGRVAAQVVRIAPCAVLVVR